MTPTVTKAGRLWVAHQRGPVAVFTGAHAEGRSRREALANLADMIAELSQAGSRLARRTWIRAITNAPLREEVMRLVLARQVVDERDFSARARNELARIDAESHAAIEAIHAGKVGKRALRRVEDCKDRLDDLITAPVIAARLREIHKHPERLISIEEVARRYGITLAPKYRRARRS
jgi:hypothetical protein